MAASSSDLLAVLPHPRILGLEDAAGASTNDPKDGITPRLAQPISLMSLGEALTARHTTDAHLVGYLPDPCEDETFFRVNTNALVPLAQAGVRVKVRYAVIDWDTGKKPNHLPWTDDVFNAFMADFEAKRRSDTPFGALLRSACAFYTTRAGARWIFRLEPAVPVDGGEANAVIWGLIQAFRENGILADEDAEGWSQLFRLPNVLRDGRWTDEAPYYVYEADLAAVLPSGHLPRNVRTKSVAVARLGPKPASDEARALIEFYDGTGKAKWTDFAKAAKEMLAGRPIEYPLVPYVFDSASVVFPEGVSRHDLILKWCATAVKMLWEHPDFSPEAVYGLFIPVVEQFEDAVRRNWPGELWREVEWACGREKANREAEVAAKLEDARQILTAEEQVTAGVREWFPALPSDRAAAWGWIQRRIVAINGRHFYVLKKDGRYGRNPLPRDAVIGQIRIGLPGLVSTSKVNQRGEASDRSIAEVLNSHGVAVSRAQPAPGGNLGGNLIELDRETPALLTRAYRRRTDIKPDFNADVDLWLRALGGDSYELLCRHIGLFLAFEKGGVAAMSWSIDSGAGKKLIFHGFLECMEDDDHASNDDLVQRFNIKLAASAFLNVNEGFCLLAGQHNHPTDTLRRVITGDYFQVERKHQDAFQVKNPIRILLTANGWRLIDVLGEGRDLAPHERDALGVRIIHYKASSAATDLLASKGGFAWTAGWIAPDGGDRSGSKFTVAKHFLWLYEQHGRNAVLKGRLLLEGDPKQEAIQRLRVQGGATPTVIETLQAMLDGNGNMGPKVTDGFCIKDGRLFVTISAIYDKWRTTDFLQASRQKLSIKSIGLSLKGLIVKGDVRDGESRSINGHQARWHEIDVPLLAAEMEAVGWKCSRLDVLVAERAAGGLEGNGVKLC